MNQFKVVPMPEAVAERIRTTLQDDFGHQLQEVKLKSRALCRLCLQDGDMNVQKHILFSYMPVERNTNPYAEVGPVYVHDSCKEYSEKDVIPPDLKKRKYLTVRGYNTGQWLVAGVMCEGEKVEECIRRMFENTDVQYLHISDAMTGCFFVKVARDENRVSAVSEG